MFCDNCSLHFMKPCYVHEPNLSDEVRAQLIQWKGSGRKPNSTKRVRLEFAKLDRRYPTIFIRKVREICDVTFKTLWNWREEFFGPFTAEMLADDSMEDGENCRILTRYGNWVTISKKELLNTIPTHWRLFRPTIDPEPQSAAKENRNEDGAPSIKKQRVDPSPSVCLGNCEEPSFS